MQLKIQHQEQRFEGPIPPPAVLQGYEQILPGAAERILRMAEQQAAHRHSLELKSINANISGADRQLELADKQLKAVYASDKLGQWLGFAVSMCCLGGGIYLGVIGQPWLAGVLVSLPIASVIKAFRDQGQQQPKDKHDEQKTN